MAKIHPGATPTPGFRDFLPQWIERQPWYRGAETPALRPVGFHRLEDPAGEAGMEAHPVSDGTDLYHVPLTYRGAPLPDAHPCPSGQASKWCESSPPTHFPRPPAWYSAPGTPTPLPSPAAWPRWWVAKRLPARRTGSSGTPRTGTSPCPRRRSRGPPEPPAVR
ncbi:maltokinase N-terminal cap-like domain-containing protein [Actinosynnema sp. CA-248983]